MGDVYEIRRWRMVRLFFTVLFCLSFIFLPIFRFDLTVDELKQGCLDGVEKMIPQNIDPDFYRELRSDVNEFFEKHRDDIEEKNGKMSALDIIKMESNFWEIVFDPSNFDIDYVKIIRNIFIKMGGILGFGLITLFLCIPYFVLSIFIRRSEDELTRREEKNVSILPGMPYGTFINAVLALGVVQHMDVYEKIINQIINRLFNYGFYGDIRIISPIYFQASGMTEYIVIPCIFVIIEIILSGVIFAVRKSNGF